MWSRGEERARAVWSTGKERAGVGGVVKGGWGSVE